MALIFMLKSISCFVASKLIFTDKGNFKGVCDGKLIDKANIAGKESEMRFLIFGAKSGFVKFKHAFCTTLILYYFNLKCSIWIKTD